VNPRRLYRCRHNHSLAGVSGGIAEYLEVDVTVVRVLWILAALLSGGLAILLYIILAFVMPLGPVPGTGPWHGAGPAGSAGSAGPAGGEAAGPAADDAIRTWSTEGWAAPEQPAWGVPVHGHGYGREVHGESSVPLVIGVALVVFGAIALAGPALPGWIAGAYPGPAILVALGIAIVVAAVRPRRRENGGSGNEPAADAQ
jgi:phage shock protein C